METAKVEDELTVEEDPDVVVTGEVEALLPAGGDAHGGAEMAGEMEVVRAAVGAGEFGVF